MVRAQKSKKSSTPEGLFPMAWACAVPLAFGSSSEANEATPAAPCVWLESGTSQVGADPSPRLFG